MKKVGLVCVTYKDNFGSSLQTYATQYVIQNLGFETGLFDISGVHKDINKKKIKFYLKRIFHKDEFKYLIENFLSRRKIKKNNINDTYAKNMAIRHKQYQLFAEQHLLFLPKPHNWGELSDQSSKCDFVVVGSDQLWRPSNIAGGFFTLEFVPDSIEKIAYATSFGVSVLPNSLKKTTKMFLDRIQHLSTREESGKKIIKETSGRDAPVVCDPTMLLDSKEWLSIQKENPIISGNYILCYFLGDNQLHREFAKRLKEITGYKIVGLIHGAVYIPSDENFADETPFDIGPGDFINLIRFSQYVCTDSFHGTVFSIINSKPFFCFRRYDDSSQFSTNDRLKTLLQWTGLTDRLLFGDENVSDLMKKNINYASVLELVHHKKTESIEYLSNALHLKD